MRKTIKSFTAGILATQLGLFLAPLCWGAPRPCSQQERDLLAVSKEKDAAAGEVHKTARSGLGSQSAEGKAALKRFQESYQAYEKAMASKIECQRSAAPKLAVLQLFDALLDFFDFLKSFKE